MRNEDGGSDRARDNTLKTIACGQMSAVAAICWRAEQEASRVALVDAEWHKEQEGLKRDGGSHGDRSGG